MSEPRVSKKAWTVGAVGAGVIGAIIVALKYALRPPTKRRVPDTISPAVFATKVLHTSLGEVVYHESGRGTPLIFVHDLAVGSSSYEWTKVYPEFAATHRVIALDVIGFGESSRPDRRFTASEYVRMLAEFIRALEWQKPPVLVASGLGAGLCVHFAAMHPELVAQLILHRPIGGSRLPASTQLIFRTPLLARFIYRNHLSTRAAVATWLRRVAFADPVKVDEETIDVFTTCAQQPGAEHAALDWLSGRVSFEFRRESQSCRCPVALLESGSLLAPIEFPDEVRKQIAAALESAQ